MGLGRFGGGVGVTRWLIEQGAKVTVTDLADERALADSVAALDGLPVTLHLGEHRDQDLDQTDLLVVNPAVNKRTSPFVQAALARGIPWTSEMNLFLERCPARIVGVTGTAGKSTTCAMIHHIVADAVARGAVPFRRAWLGGNIGRSLLSDLADMTTADVVVLELSSFQLEDAAAVQRSPDVAVILNVWPNHLDRHGDERSYLDAKLNIVRYQRPGDIVVAGTDEPNVASALAAVVGGTRAKSQTVPERRRFSLVVPGAHNQANAACAATVGEVLGVSDETSRASLASFAGLPHRLEHVGTHQAVDYYNDSKSTTPQAVVTAVEAFDRPLVVLVGGHDKGLPLERMAGVLVKRAAAVACFGAAGDRLAASLRAVRDPADAPVIHRTDRMNDAVTWARSTANAGDVVLLSPGCSSFDEFANYEHRGRAFAEQVRGWKT